MLCTVYIYIYRNIYIYYVHFHLYILANLCTIRRRHQDVLPKLIVSDPRAANSEWPVILTECFRWSPTNTGGAGFESVMEKTPFFRWSSWVDLFFCVFFFLLCFCVGKMKGRWFAKNRERFIDAIRP